MFQGRLKAAGSAAGFGYVGSVNYLDSDGFREHSSARLFRGNLVASRSLGDRGEIRALANFFRTPYAQNPSSLDLDDAVNRPRTVRPAIVAQGAAEIATQGHGGAALDLGLGETARLRAVAWAGGRDGGVPVATSCSAIGRDTATTAWKERKLLFWIHS